MKVTKVVHEDIARKIGAAFILEELRHIDGVAITFTNRDG